MKRIGLFLIWLVFLPGGMKAQVSVEERVVVRIRVSDPESQRVLEELNIDRVSEGKEASVDAVVTVKELAGLARRGFKTDLLPIDPPGMHVTQYPSYEQIMDKLNLYAQNHSRIMVFDTLGFSQNYRLPIPVIKVSDQPGQDEDEPALLFDGLHHAREPVGMLCVMNILEYLLMNYGSDAKITDWVNQNEIWFIPIVNPDGYKYLMDNNLTNPWWRKNLRDNNQNGIIDPSYDGVDLNRNYQFGWASGGSTNPGDWTYRGTAPFSESETTAKKVWAQAQKPILSLSYHSYGEQFLYSWAEEPRAPDHALIVQIGDSMAIRTPRMDQNGHYSVDPSECTTGYSKCWMYGKLGTIEYTVETANQFVPPYADGSVVARNNLNAALYLFDRIKGPGITGRVTDAGTGQPLVARIRVLEIPEGKVDARMSESKFGRFYRLLQPGTYTVQVSRTGYNTRILGPMQIPEGNLVQLDVPLTPLSTGISELEQESVNTGCRDLKIWPNPSGGEVHVGFVLEKPSRVSVTVRDLTGKIMTQWHESHLPDGYHEFSWNGLAQGGHRLAGGLYLLTLVTEGGLVKASLIRE